MFEFSVVDAKRLRQELTALAAVTPEPRRDGSIESPFRPAPENLVSLGTPPRLTRRSRSRSPSPMVGNGPALVVCGSVIGASSAEMSVQCHKWNRGLSHMSYAYSLRGAAIVAVLRTPIAAPSSRSSPFFSPPKPSAAHSQPPSLISSPSSLSHFREHASCEHGHLCGFRAQRRAHA